MCVVMGLVLFTSSCKKEEGASGDTVLYSFGPCPIARGAELRFVGENLNKVQSITLPGDIEITSSSFTSVTKTLITITVPQNAVPGYITLNLADGTITTKTELGFSEPISIASFSPLSTKFDSVITITGDYLNLIKQVIFTSNAAVNKDDFVSQSRYQLQVKVPAAAQTGKIAVSNGADNPIIVYSSDSIKIDLPEYISISPNPIKAGDTLVIQGKDLNVITSVIFGGGKKSTGFGKNTITQIKVKVPADAQDGKIKLVAASGIEIMGTDSLVMTVPIISSVTPNPVKPGSSITVSGTNLDLITSAIYGGDKSGSVTVGGNSSQIIINVPIDAQGKTVQFNTAANKSVPSPSPLEMIKPAITSITPLAVVAKDSITISGTDLDLIATVQFMGDKTVSVSDVDPSQFKVKVPVGAQSGNVAFIAKNGDQVVSNDMLSITPAEVPGVTNIPLVIKLGSMITITGTKLDLFTDVIFPGNIKATMFGEKTSTTLQVIVPTTVTMGTGNVQFITKDGDSNTSPSVHFWNADPTIDQSLVFFNFDGKDKWWGDGVTENDASLTLDGSNYTHINSTYSGWATFFARNSKNDFPASTIGADVDNYVYKFDINVLEPITAGLIQCRLQSNTDGDYWSNWNPWSGSGSYQTNGWITITLPLSSFLNDGGKVASLKNLPVADLNTIDSEFSINFNTGSWAGGDSKVNVLIDNVRFEHK